MSGKHSQVTHTRAQVNLTTYMMPSLRIAPQAAFYSFHHNILTIEFLRLAYPYSKHFTGYEEEKYEIISIMTYPGIFLN